jgi:DNA-binding NarL/FixJ family response regulator
MSLKVLVVSDSHLLRAGLRSILEFQTSIRILRETGFDRVTETVLSEADLVLFDLDPKGNDILGAIATVQKTCKGTPILLLADLADYEFARRALALGAHGIALKIQPPGVLIAAIQDLCPKYDDKNTQKTVSTDTKKLNTKTILNPDISDTGGFQKIYTLTNREREIIRLVCLGLKNKDIASRLSISDITVRHHLTSIFCKLEVADRQKLLILAYRYGVAELTLRAESA